VITLKAVLWDLDDTLYSRRDAVRQLFPGLLRACLYTDRSDEFIREAVEFLMTQIKGNRMICETAFRALLERYPGDRPYIHEACVAYYYANIRSFALPSDDTVQILRKLKAQGIKMAIVTNITPELLEHQHKKVAALGIAELFDEVIYSAEFGVHKPDRRIFDHAAALLGVSNEECLFVGDDPDSDVVGARNAGMEVVWLDHRQTDDRFRDDPCVHRVQSVGEYFKV
jgi:putative hydrolase of the HAD superfamily